MVCDVCKTEMNDSIMEMEIPVNGEMIKAVNVPSLVCPKCNKQVVESLVEKQAQIYAKRCKDDTFDYSEVEPRGFGIKVGKE